SDKQNNWKQEGLMVVAYEGGLSGKTATIDRVMRTGNSLMVDVSLANRTDGCGYCDQDEVRIARRDLLGVTNVSVRYTCVDCGPVGPAGSVAADSYSVGPQGGVGADDLSNQVSWGALKATYR